MTGIYLWKVVDNNALFSSDPLSQAQLPLEVIQGSDSFVVGLSTPVSYSLSFKEDVVTL